jgi:hypothetical protein
MKDDSNTNKVDKQEEPKVIPSVDKFIFVSLVFTSQDVERVSRLFEEVKARKDYGNEGTKTATETSGKGYRQQERVME